MWLPEPDPATQICVGFDGSEVDDWTALRAETIDGFQFTPRYGPDRRPTIWNPAEHFDHRTPRLEVAAAVREVYQTYAVLYGYFDPPLWATEIEEWRGEFGDVAVQNWATFRPAAMHFALERFVTDLQHRRIEHDACPITDMHMANARKVARGRDQYLLEKPNRHQKIDAAMASVLAHEAAADARAGGWGEPVDRTVRILRTRPRRDPRGLMAALADHHDD